MTRKPTPIWQKELSLFLILVGVGLIALPLGIYFLGSQVAGEYAGEGIWGLFTHIVTDLGGRNLFAWVLVLAPYLAMQLFRLSVAVLRHRETVKDVTIPE